MIDFTTIRTDRSLYYSRVIQLIFSIVVLGITGDNSSGWQSLGCNTPAKLSFNIACAAITLPALIYYLVSTGPSTRTRRLPWHVYAQLGLDAFLFLLWLAATAASKYDCAGLCSACAGPGDADPFDGSYLVYVGSLNCPCLLGAYSPDARRVKRRLLENRAGGGSSSSSALAGAGKDFESASKVASKIGFDALMILLFACTLGVTVWHVHQARKAGSPTTSHGPATEILMQGDSVHDGSYQNKSAGAASGHPASEVQ